MQWYLILVLINFHHPCCSVTKSYLTLCDRMKCSMSGFPLLQYILEFVQTYVHWVSDAIQSSNPLFPPCPPALSLPSIRVFSNESALSIRWTKYWRFSFSISPSNSGLISFRVDWFDLLAVQGTLKTSQTSQFESINSLTLSLLYGPTHICARLLEKP